MPAPVVFGGGHKLKVTVTNISEGGMAMFPSSELPPGNASTVVVKVPEIAPLRNRSCRSPGWMDHRLFEQCDQLEKCPN